MHNLTIKNKILIFTSTLFILIGIISIYFQTSAIEKILYSEKKQQTKEIINLANSMLNVWHQQAIDGKISMEDAKAKGIEQIKNLRYGNDGKNYLWIHDTETRMVMHPYKPQLNGKDLSNVEDKKGNNLFIMMNEEISSQGEGYVEYYWQWKDDPTKIYPKISYVKLFRPWNWVLGTGAYINIIQEIKQKEAIKVSIIYAATLLIALFIIMLLGKNINSIIKTLLTDATNVANRSKQGDLTQRINADEIHNEFKSIALGLNETIDTITKPIEEAKIILEKMSDKNINTEMIGNYKGDHAALKNAINGTLDSFNSILSEVYISSDQVSSGSNQIEIASGSLAQGASEQASSLEEISSTMNMIGGQTKINAENAKQAKELSEEAKSSADVGNSHMNEMLMAMTDISNSSENISKIIKVIDEIAFQTNLLALNAAVEAARAGKHGKGFAVVAEEVRNLAKRSAQAAQETTDMIEDSIKKVSAGTNIAKNTAQALEGIVTSSVKVTDLVNEISSASSEQAESVSQIVDGLDQVSNVTQQNASMAEQSAATSKDLSQQADRLTQAIKQFTLKDSQEHKKVTPQAPAKVIPPKKPQSTPVKEAPAPVIAKQKTVELDSKPKIETIELNEKVEIQEAKEIKLKPKTKKSDDDWGKKNPTKKPQILLDDSEFGKY